MLASLLGRKARTITAAEALAGRATRPFAVPDTHFVNGNRIQAPFPAGLESIVVGMGCFWGAERMFWKVAGVYATAVGYTAGFTPHPTYEEVCSGFTAHNEVVMVWFDPSRTSFATMLKTFWENHDPTQGMRQGNDVGTQYRSGLYVFSAAQKAAAEASKQAFQVELAKRGYPAITTEILDATTFFHAEDYHQQYLAKNPNGYCGIGGTGVSCPIGIGVAA